MTLTDFPAPITLLSAGGVEFIVIGGIVTGTMRHVITLERSPEMVRGAWHARVA